MHSRESSVLAIGLSVVAGCVDVLGYLALVRIFSGHMSGNVVTAAALAARRSWAEAGLHALPIPLFLLGVGVGTLLVEASVRRFPRYRYLPVLGCEVLALGASAGLLATVDPGAPARGPLRLLVLALLVLAMGLQNATVRRSAGEKIRTTFVTGMLTDLMEGLTRKLSGREPGHRTGLLSALLAGYAAGAALAGLIHGHARAGGLWWPAAGLVLLILWHARACARTAAAAARGA